jgi:hypothetical protein
LTAKANYIEADAALAAEVAATIKASMNAWLNGYLCGGRDADWATQFMEDLASRLATRIQITTDGLTHLSW